jgi:heat shock 70kDa protein 1/2/6/8
LATNSLKYWPFKFSYDEQSLPTVEITIKEDKLKKKPDEVAGKIFEKLKEASPSTRTDIVLSMPVFFDDDQKQSLKEAAKVAGLNVVEFISDPAAALYAYAHEFGIKNSANLLIFDFGGSKCDVMVAQIDGGQANVLAVGGDLFLGGRDIDHLLMDYFAEQIKNKHEKDVFENAKTRQRLLRECIEVKHTLANMNESGYSFVHLRLFK